MNRSFLQPLLPAATALGLAASGGTLASGATLAEALDAAPANAEIVLAFPSLQGFSGMVSRLADSAGVGDEGTSDLLGTFKRELGLGPGLDDDGPGLIVLTRVGQTLIDAFAGANGPGESEPVAILLLPVTDYAAFVESLEKPAVPGSVMPEGVTAVLIEGEASAVRQAGSFAVLGEEAAMLASYEAAKGAAAALEATGGYAVDAQAPDVAMWVNMAALRPGLEAAIDGGVDALLNDGFAGGAGMAGAATRAVASFYAPLLRGTTQSFDSVLVSARMTADNLQVDAAMRVNAGSPGAAFLTDQRAEPLALLGRMPDAAFVTASVLDLSAFDVAALKEAAVGSVQQAVGRFGEDADGESAKKMADAMRAVVDAWGEMVQPAEGATALARVNYPSNPQAMMAGGIFQTLDVTSAADPAAVRAALPGRFLAMETGFAPALNRMMAELSALQAEAGLGGAGAGAGAAPAAAPEVAISTTVNANALTLAGTQVDQYTMSFALPPEMLESMGPAGFALGNAGVSGFSAATDTVHLLTTSAEPAFMERALLAAKGDGGAPTLSNAASLEGVGETLPEGLVGANFFAFQGVAEAANPFIGMFLLGVAPLDVPVDLPPMSLSAGMKPAAGAAAGTHDVGLRWNVPVPMIEFARDSYLNFAPLFGGGPGAGDGRAPGQGPPPAPF